LSETTTRSFWPQAGQWVTFPLGTALMAVGVRHVGQVYSNMSESSVGILFE
jgi:hypothetical protein